MTYGYPHVCDPHTSDISRFYPHERTEHHILARCAEHFNKTYGIVHPREQWASRAGHAPQPVLRTRGGPGRGVLRRPRLGAPAVVRVQRRAAREVPAGERAPRRTSGTRGGGRRSPTPSTWRCATASAWSTSRRSTSSTSRDPGALAGLQHITRQLRRRGGRALGLHAVAHPRRRVPRRPHDPAPRRRALPRRSPAPSTVAATSTGSAGTCRPTARSRSPTARSALCTLGLWGPNAEAVLATVVTPGNQRVGATDDVSHAGFPYGAVREVLDRRHPVHAVPHLLRRRERLGDLHRASSTACACGTRSPPPARRSASCRSASACTPSPAGSRRATA